MSNTILCPSGTSECLEIITNVVFSIWHVVRRTWRIITTFNHKVECKPGISWRHHSNSFQRSWLNCTWNAVSGFIKSCWCNKNLQVSLSFVTQMVENGYSVLDDGADGVHPKRSADSIWSFNMSLFSTTPFSVTVCCGLCAQFLEAERVFPLTSPFHQTWPRWAAVRLSMCCCLWIHCKSYVEEWDNNPFPSMGRSVHLSLATLKNK